MDELVKLLASLGIDTDNTDKIVGVAAKLLESETEKGKGFSRKYKNEAQNLRESLKKLGYNSDEYESVDAYLSAREKDNEQKDITLNSLKEALDSMKSDLETERKLRADTEAKAMRDTVRADLANALGGKVYGAEYVINGILSDGGYGVKDGTTMIGDVTITDYVDSLRQKSPDIFKTEQQPGGGNPPTGGANGGVKLADMSLDDIMK